jgi:hypothetical protein
VTDKTHNWGGCCGCCCCCCCCCWWFQGTIWALAWRLRKIDVSESNSIKIWTKLDANRCLDITFYVGFLKDYVICVGCMCFMSYAYLCISGENPAAMQHGGRGLSWLHSPSAWLLLACVAVSVLSGRLTFTTTVTPSNERANMVDYSP